MSKDKIKGISKAHTVYKLADGTRVPGATTITGLLNKPHLVRWANKLGLEGIDSSKYTDEAAAVGTLAHALVQAHLQGETLDTTMFSPTQVDLAENAVLSYLEWEKRHKIEPLICEVPMVSEKLRYGGTVDCYCRLDGVPTLIFDEVDAGVSGRAAQKVAYKPSTTSISFRWQATRICCWSTATRWSGCRSCALAGTRQRALRRGPLPLRTGIFRFSQIC